MLIAILTNCPDEATADAIADALISARLVACANRYPAIESRYRWQGRVAVDREVPLLLKTRPDLADRVVDEVRRRHPYDTPAILRLSLTAEADYLAWIAAETATALPPADL